MRRRPARAWAAATLLFLACANADAPTAEAVRLIDATGSEVVLPRPARRVVSLVPSATETFRAMGRADVLVGRTDYDTHAWSTALPSVGGGIEPSLEAIVALQPDLVVRFAGEQDTHTPARLTDLGVPVLAVRPDRVEDIFRTAELLGDAIGDRQAADSLAAELRTGLAAAADKAHALPPVRVAYVLGGTPPWVAGRGTFIDDLVTLMGGDNVFSDVELLYAAVSPEEFRTRRIDVVLVSDAAGFDASLAPGARVEQVESDFEIPGPGVVEAAYRIAERIHGRKLE